MSPYHSTWLCRVFGHRIAWRAYQAEREVYRDTIFARYVPYCSRCFLLPVGGLPPVGQAGHGDSDVDRKPKSPP